MDYSWIAGIFEGAFKTTIDVTNTVVNGKNQRATIDAEVSTHNTDKTQNSKTVRALIIGGAVVLAIVVFGLFVYSNRRK